MLHRDIEVILELPESLLPVFSSVTLAVYMWCLESLYQYNVIVEIVHSVPVVHISVCDDVYLGTLLSGKT